MANIKLTKSELAALDYILSTNDDAQEGIVAAKAEEAFVLDAVLQAVIGALAGEVARRLANRAFGPGSETAFKKLTPADLDLLSDKIMEELRKKPSLEQLREIRKNIDEF